MLRPKMRSLIASSLVFDLIATLSGAAFAIDGVTLIDQNKALAGNVTPGDSPGFPVTISLPGSYRLDGNLTVPDASTDAILITANNVTVDLNGFMIMGPTVCGRPAGPIVCSPVGPGNGVNAPQVSNVTIVNGTIRGMGSSGISLLGPIDASPNRVDRVAAHSNGASGILLNTGFVTNNVTGTNGIWGIAINLGRVSGNHSTNNEAGPLFLQNGAYSNNSFQGNGFNGNENTAFGGGLNLGQNLCGSVVCSGAQF